MRGRSFILQKYIFFEILKSSFVGSIIAISILFSLQLLRLTRKIIQLDVDFEVLLKLFFGICVGFLPAVLPIAFIMAVMLVVNRMSVDKEFVSLFSIGISYKKCLQPILVAALMFSVFTGFVSLKLGPYGYDLFQKTLAESMSKNITNVIRAKVFNKDFLNLMIYVNEITEEEQEFKGVFIQDENNFQDPVYIYSNSGKWMIDDKRENGKLVLKNGYIFSYGESTDSFRKINFEEYNLNAHFNISAINNSGSPTSWSYAKLKKKEQAVLMSKNGNPKSIWVEISRRFALIFFSIFCIPLAFSLSMSTKRSIKNRAILLSIIVSLIYWLSYSSIFSFILKSPLGVFSTNQLVVWLLVWIPNILMLTIGFVLLNGLRRPLN